MSAVAAPSVEVEVTPSAATEIKKFMASEDDLPETSGLRVRVVPGGCSGFQYSLNIEEESKQDLSRKIMLTSSGMQLMFASVLELMLQQTNFK